MKIPVSASKNLITGEMTFAYADMSEEKFLNVFADLYNETHPEAPVVVSAHETK